jgi:replication factor C subunit 2/4
MRQAINNMQSVVAGFDLVNADNVHTMVDTPHPAQCKEILEACDTANMSTALSILSKLWQKGYAPLDIISTLFRVAKSATFLGEQKQLDFIKVYRGFPVIYCKSYYSNKLLCRKLALRICELWMAYILKCSWLAALLASVDYR